MIRLLAIRHAPVTVEQRLDFLQARRFARPPVSRARDPSSEGTGPK